jgi:antirestriction protein ArdC
VHLKAFADYQGISGKEFYAGTLMHESVHAAGSAGRLKRDCLERYGISKPARAEEELVAELGAAFLGAHFGLSTLMRPDHAVYVGSWLGALRDKFKRSTFFRAMNQAEASVKFILEQIEVGNSMRPGMPRPPVV